MFGTWRKSLAVGAEICRRKFVVVVAQGVFHLTIACVGEEPPVASLLGWPCEWPTLLYE